MRKTILPFSCCLGKTSTNRGGMQPRFNVNFFIILLTLVFGAAQIAWAACTSPAANAGAREYANGTYRLCDGTNWQDPYCASPTWTATLRGYWKLDEAANNAADSSGNANTGTQSNGTWAPYGGYRDGGLTYNGTTTYVNGGSVAGLDDLFAASGLSVSAWIYPTGLGENSNAQIIGKDASTTANATTGWFVRLTGTNRIHFSVDYTGGANNNLLRESANNAITLNAWNHVVVTWTGSATATNAHIYVNGTEVTYATSTNGATTRSSDAASNLTIGNNGIGNLSRTFAGTIDEVYIFNGIVSATEIALLKSRGCARLTTCATTASTTEYDSSIPGYKYCDGASQLQLSCSAVTVAEDPDEDYIAPTSGLTSYWKFNESSGTSAADSAGSNTGTLTNMNTPSVWVSGYSSNALDFDGSNDYVALPAPGIMGTGATTFSAWIYPRYTGAGIATLFGMGYQGLECGVLGWNASYSCSHDAFSTWSTTPTGSYVPNQWVHFVAVRHSDGTTTLYLNGSQSGAAHQASGTVNAGTISSALGAAYNGANGFDGLMDEVRIYNRELSSSEISDLYGINLQRGLIGHWKLDESSGTLADSSGSSNSGTAQNSPTYAPTGGRMNGAINFDGTNDRIDIANESNFDLDYTQPFTLSTWVYRDTSTTEDGLIEKVDSSLDYRGYSVWLPQPSDCPASSANCIQLDIKNASVTSAASVNTNGGAIATAGWYHIVATYNGNSSISGMKIYVNGVSQAVNTVTNNLSATSLNNNPVLLGDDTTNDNCCELDGKMDDVRIYNREFSEAEVAALYKASGPVFRWQLDESSGSTAADTGGNYNGTVYGAGTWVPSGGKFNGGMTFDGTDDCVYNSSVSLAGANKVTVSFWTKRNWASGAYETLMEGTDNFNTPTTGYAIFFTGSGDVSDSCANYEMEVYLKGNTGHNGKCYTPPSDQNWHLLTAVYDKSQAATDEVKLYIDGILQNSTAQPHSGNNTNNFGNDSFNFMTRACPATTAAEAMTGTSDDLRVYDRVLSATEIRSLYTAGLVSGLVAHWKLDESAGTAAADSSGAGNNATTTNGPVWGPYTGQINGALTFDGVNDYLSEAAIDLSGTNAVTVAGWVNRTYSAAGAHTLFEFTTNYNSFNSGFGFFPDDTGGCGGGGGLLVAVNGDVGYSEKCYTQPSSGVWHHLVAVYDKSQAGANEINLGAVVAKP